VYKNVEAILPYALPSIGSRYLRVDVELNKLTILVGPNASGKTSVLEALGYIASAHLSALHSVLSLSLVTTLRPRDYMPAPMGGTIVIDSKQITSLYMEPMYPLILKAKPELKK